MSAAIEMPSVSATTGEIGWYGKLPAAGDFLMRRLPDSFRLPWDQWLCAGMIEAKEQFSDDWEAAFLSFPVWRFLWHAGAAQVPVWAGVLVPGVDRVGRLFPLTVALPIDQAGLARRSIAALDRQLDAIQVLALRVLEDDDIEAFDRELRALTVSHEGESAPNPWLQASSATPTVLAGIDAAGWIESLGLRQWLGSAPSVLFWTRDPEGTDVLRIEDCPPASTSFGAMLGARQPLHEPVP